MKIETDAQREFCRAVREAHSQAVPYWWMVGLIEEEVDREQLAIVPDPAEEQPPPLPVVQLAPRSWAYSKEPEVKPVKPRAKRGPKGVKKMQPVKKGAARYSQGLPMGGRPMRATSKQGRAQGNQDQTAISKRPRKTGQK
jgi:hypothetical protein